MRGVFLPKRILFVTNNYFPRAGTCTNILLKLLYDGGLQQHLGQVDVLCGKDHIDDPDQEQVDGMTVRRANAWTLVTMQEVKAVAKKHPLTALCAVAEKLLHKLLVFGNGAFIDRFASRAFYRALRELHAEDYDYIVTISGRYYHTDAVLRYHRKTGARFVFYQVDPLGGNLGMSPASRARRVAYEKELYRCAQHVLTTPILLRENAAIFARDLIEKAKAMEFPLLVVTADNAPEIQKEGPPLCSFIGNIYGDIRDPSHTLRLFAPLISEGLADVQFIGGIQTDQLPKIQAAGIRCPGPLPLEDALDAMRRSAFLINIGNSVLNQMPSKLIDYVATGRPIVNICKSRACPSIVFLKDYPLALTLYENDPDIDAQLVSLKRFLAANAGVVLDGDIVRNLYRAFTPAYCARIMEELLL